MWVKICNLNHIPKIGRTDSRSCRRRDLFLKLCFDVCLCERSVPQLLSGHYASLRTFLLPREGNTPCLIHPVVCLFCANSRPFCIRQVKSPQLFLFSASLMSFNSQLCEAVSRMRQNLWEFVISLNDSSMNLNEMNKK